MIGGYEFAILQMIEGSELAILQTILLTLLLYTTSLFQLSL